MLPDLRKIEDLIDTTNDCYNIKIAEELEKMVKNKEIRSYEIYENYVAVYSLPQKGNITYLYYLRKRN